MKKGFTIVHLITGIVIVLIIFSVLRNCSSTNNKKSGLSPETLKTFAEAGIDTTSPETIHAGIQKKIREEQEKARAEEQAKNAPAEEYYY